MNKLKICLAVLVSINGLAHANDQKHPTAASDYVIDIEQVKKDFAIPKSDSDVITKDVIKMRNKALDDAKMHEGADLPEMQTEVRFDKMKPIKGQTLPDIKQIEKFHQVKDIKNSEVDINAMLAHYQNLQKSGATEKNIDSTFESGRAYLFVSSSMPKQTLKKMMERAAELEVSVFFRGNIDDKDPLKFNKMRQYLASLNLQKKPDIKIHPPAFTKFKIDKVPALVVAAEDVDKRLDENGCANPLDYDILHGDINIGWAIEKIYTDSESDAIKKIAAKYMTKINVSKGDSE